MSSSDVTVTPYEGGKFIVNVNFTDNSPLKAPKITTKAILNPGTHNCRFISKQRSITPNIKQDICAKAIENIWFQL
jgi:ubiquitin-protein ligase